MTLVIDQTFINDYVDKTYQLFFELPWEPFELEQDSLSTDGTSEFRVFSELFLKKRITFSEDLAPIFSQLYKIELDKKVHKKLAVSLIVLLERLLHPILQSEWEGFCQQVYDAEINETDKNLQHIFLQEMSILGFKRLFKARPVLKNLVQRVLICWWQNTFSLFARLEMDYALLSSKMSLLGVPCRLIDIESGLSDSHQGMDSVKILWFSQTHAVVYKPRSLEAEERLYRFLDDLTVTGFSIEFQSLWILLREGYSWMEYCCPVEDLSEIDIVSHGRQYGALMALWLLLGGNDLHHENISVSLLGPVILDAETLFATDYEHYQTDSILKKNSWIKPSYEHYSVVSTSMLPTFIRLDEEDYRAVSGTLVYENLFQFNGVEELLVNQQVKWEQFKNATCEGLEDIFNYVLNDMGVSTFKSLVLQTFTGSAQRILVRDTLPYMKILEYLTQDYDSLSNREQFLKTIDSKLKILFNEFDFLENIRVNEIKQLAAFDIPYFYRVMGENSLYGNDLSVVLEPETDFCSIHGCLQQLDLEWIQWQVEISRLLLTPHQQLDNYRLSTATGNQLAHQEVCSLNKQIYINAFESQPLYQVRRMSLLVKKSLEYSDLLKFRSQQRIIESNQFSQNEFVGYGMYTGFMGRLTFLGALACLDDDEALRQFVQVKTQELLALFSLKNAMQLGRKRGISEGTPAILYGLHVLDQLNVFKMPISLAQDFFMFSLDDAIVMDPDFLTGFSGEITLLSCLYKYMPNKVLTAYKHCFIETANKYINSWEDLENETQVGLAHGALGVAFAAARLFEHTQDSNLCMIMKKLIAYEERLVNRLPEYTQNLSWCYGHAGRAITLYESGRILEDDSMIDHAMQLISLKRQPLNFKNHTLCCGSLGYVAANMYINKSTEDYQSKKCRNQYYNDFYHNWETRFKYESNNMDRFMDLSFFLGSSGAGYTMLYSMEPQNIPAIWAFE
ncbi:MAG: DUF4135 domain-containing protein [Vampirovibrio sp.]|nr:DUF4135 domain-containing protein [Vampirovibrio sp.]